MEGTVIAKRGDRVSLILTRRVFFFQTEGGITLSEDNSSTVIPDSATDEHLTQINLAISNGHLVLGVAERKADMPDRDSDIKNILLLGRNKIDEWLYNIRSDKTVKTSEKVSCIEKLIEFERVGKNRKSVMVSADRTLKTIGGISQVTESDQEKLEIKLTSGNVEQ